MKNPYDVKKAEEAIKMREYLRDRFRGWANKRVDEYDKYKKQEQPMIDAIGNLGERLESKLDKAIENQSKELVPFRKYPLINTSEDLEVNRTLNDSEVDNVLRDFAEETQKREMKYIANQMARDYQQDEESQELGATPKRKPTFIGLRLLKYLNNCNDKTFGLKSQGAEKYIGDEPVEFSTLTIGGRQIDQLSVLGKTYEATDGLMNLLTQRILLWMILTQNLKKMICRIMLKFYLEQMQYFVKVNREQVKEQNTNQ